MALRTNMRRRTSRDMRGKITCGHKVYSEKAKKEIPQSLNHFNVSKFPEVAATYGDKPTKLIVFFPTNTIEDFFFTEYSLWGGSGDTAVKKRACDGANALDTKTGECKECFCATLPDKEQCKSYTSIKAYIADNNNGRMLSPMLYQFETHSDNSSDGVYSELLKIWEMTGGKLVGVPFQIEVKFIKKITGQQFPILHLQSLPNLDAIHALAARAVLPTAPINALPMRIDGEVPQLAEPQKIAALPEPVVTGDEAPLEERLQTVSPVNVGIWAHFFADVVRIRQKDKRDSTDQKKLIGLMVMCLADAEPEDAADMLEKFTEFPSVSGVVPGVRSVRDLNSLTDKRIRATYGKIKTEFERVFKSELAKKEAPFDDEEIDPATGEVIPKNI